MLFFTAVLSVSAGAFADELRKVFDSDFAIRRLGSSFRCG